MRAATGSSSRSGTAMVPAPLGAVFAALLFLVASTTMATVSVYKVYPTPRQASRTTAPSSAAASYEGGSPVYPPPPRYRDIAVPSAASSDDGSSAGSNGGQQYLLAREQNGSLKLYETPLVVLTASPDAIEDVVVEEADDATETAGPPEQELQQQTEQQFDATDVSSTLEEEGHPKTIMVSPAAKDKPQLGVSQGADVDVTPATGSPLEVAESTTTPQSLSCKCPPNAKVDKPVVEDVDTAAASGTLDKHCVSNERRLQMGTGALIAFFVAALVLL